MIKLHPETAKEIAQLFNCVSVSEMLANDATDVDERIYWRARKYKTIIEITEKYHIPHCLYDNAIETMKDDLYINAKLP